MKSEEMLAETLKALKTPSDQQKEIVEKLELQEQLKALTTPSDVVPVLLDKGSFVSPEFAAKFGTAQLEKINQPVDHKVTEHRQLIEEKMLKELGTPSEPWIKLQQLEAKIAHVEQGFSDLAKIVLKMRRSVEALTGRGI